MELEAIVMRHLRRVHDIMHVPYHKNEEVTDRVGTTQRELTKVNLTRQLGFLEHVIRI